MAATELPMQVFRAVVVRVEGLMPTMRRVVLGGPALLDFRSTGVGDEYVRLFFPPQGATEPTLPEVVDNAIDYASVDLRTLRTYTVRSHDPASGEVTVDIVVHEEGVASGWARTAQPGDVVSINTPTGLYDPPGGLVRQTLVADCAGLPALARSSRPRPRECRPTPSRRCRTTPATSGWRASPQRYAALDARTRASLEQMWTSERPEEDIEVEYDERLSELGL